MIISSVNRDTAIRENIMDTIRQIKIGGIANLPLVIDGLGELVVDFYVDKDRTELLFSENTVDDPDSFTTNGTKTLYIPPDELINFAPTISDQYAQPFYYVDVIFDEYTVVPYTYRNVDNLMFQSVIASSKKNPKFATNENSCIVVPVGETSEEFKNSDDLATAFPAYELYVQLTNYDWSNLSEETRLAAAENVNNIIRDALYADRYRANNATLYDANLNGTYVGQIMTLPSDGPMKAVLKVQCAFMVSSTTY